jgi:hypothetical protein
MAHRDLIPRLLSRRNQLSRPEKEEILERVLAQVAPDRRRRARKAWLAACVGLGAAAALLLLVPRLAHRGPAGEESFTARGADDRPSFRVDCLDASGAARCRAGARLRFEVSPGTRTRFFAAFARRQDGAVIWYFPDAPGGSSKDLSRDLARGVLDSQVVLGPEHVPGSYQVEGIFSARPLDRTEVKRLLGADDPAQRQGIVVVERRLVVE